MNNHWLVLITTFPADQATPRMRVWRALKTAGAAVLKDGVYLLPDRPECVDLLVETQAEVFQAKGHAWLLTTQAQVNDNFVELFDRTAEYVEFQQDLLKLESELLENSVVVFKQIRKLHKVLNRLESIDYFPGKSLAQTKAMLQEVERRLIQKVSPHEPNELNQAIHVCNTADYQKKTWATRQHLWVDRMASAWLIRRFIDPKAQFIWLEDPADCPANVIGFDFDGAAFTHSAGLVTFEVLMESFGLNDSALSKIATIVHYLDAGGLQPPEAPGVESMLAGLRAQLTDDHALLNIASSLFDALYLTFQNESV